MLKSKLSFIRRSDESLVGHLRIEGLDINDDLVAEDIVGRAEPFLDAVNHDFIILVIPSHVLHVEIRLQAIIEKEGFDLVTGSDVEDLRLVVLDESCDEKAECFHNFGLLCFGRYYNITEKSKK